MAQETTNRRRRRSSTRQENRRPEARSNTRQRRASTRPRRTDGQARPAAQRGRNAALDGLRALAIISVFFYHLDVRWLPSGHLGVIMFFVLTGYLVTSSLVKHLRDGFGSIPRFWAKRIARLWPPTAIMIGLTVLACIAFNHVLLTKARPDVLPGLGFFENLSYILRNVSYFEQIGGPSPLTHLWYLGVDVQFCLVWPLIVLLFALLPSRTTARRLTFLLALVSAVAMGVLYNPQAGITRIYYGTDTRAFALLIGAWLAYALPLGKRPARDVRPLVEGLRLPIELAAVVSLVALAIAMVLVPDTSALLYRGGMFCASLLSALVLAALVLPGGFLSAVLSAPPLAWLGSRSLGIYLWHYPLIQLLNAATNTAAWWVVPLVAVLSMVLAELSHQFVEKPLAALMAQPASPRDKFDDIHAARAPLVAGLLACALVAVGDGVGLALIPEETLVPEEAIVSTGDAADKAMDVSKGVTNTIAPGDLPVADEVLHASSKAKEQGLYDPVFIGDSVPGDAAAHWTAACPDSLIDCYVGRRPDQALEVLRQYLDQGVVGNIVILQAFTNTAVRDFELEQMISACGDRTVFLVNARTPETVEAEVNHIVYEAAQRHSNVHLIDWYSYSDGHTDWVYADGEHLTPTGQPEYVNLIVDAIDEAFADAGGSITRRDASSSDQGTGMSVVVDNTSQASASQDSATEAPTQADKVQADKAQPVTDEEGLGGTLKQADSPMRILMLGNSLTYYNSMPTMLAEITGAEVVTHSRGGARLSEQLDPDTRMGTSTLEALEEGGWDYVILQEQSTKPVRTKDEYLKSVSELTELVRACGATPIIYATWPFAESAERLAKLGMSREEMAEMLRTAFDSAASSTGALVADVESAFQNAPSVELLYAQDGVHPSAIGSRLAAETIAQTIEEDQQGKKA